MSAIARAANGLWRCGATPAARRFARAMGATEQTQRMVLRRILDGNALTDFGKSHRFAKLRGAEDFTTAVPARDYVDLLPWINAAAGGKPDVLSPGRPLAFLPTSGTAAGTKLIPWTTGLKHDFHNALGPWVHGFMRAHPRAWSGPAYWSLSPPAWPDGRTEGGIPIGFESDAAYLPGFLRPVLRHVFAVPDPVARIRDHAAWQHVTLLHLLAAGDLSMISIWSPTFLTSLLAPLDDLWPVLLEDLERGTCASPPGSPGPRMRVDLPSGSARRARDLRRMSDGGKPPSMPEIWPRLAAISCWTDAAAGMPARRLAALFPHAEVIGKGLVATEGVVSIPWPEADAPVLAITSHFLEFENDAGRVSPAWELDNGACYSVLLTTGGGLYRYRLHDRIQVHGHLGTCPMIRFIGREGVTSDLCGEKLTEPFVRSCLEQVARTSGIQLSFALLAPVAGGTPPGYRLYYATEPGTTADIPVAMVESAMHANVHYAHARRLGQLAAMSAVRVPGNGDWAWARFQSAMAARGRRLGDIKPTALDPESGWDLVFDCATTNHQIATA